MAESHLAHHAQHSSEVIGSLNILIAIVVLCMIVDERRALGLLSCPDEDNKEWLRWPRSSNQMKSRNRDWLWLCSIGRVLTTPGPSCNKCKQILFLVDHRGRVAGPFPFSPHRLYPLISINIHHPRTNAVKASTSHTYRPRRAVRNVSTRSQSVPSVRAPRTHRMRT